MNKRFKALLCATAFIGAMTTGFVFADDLTIDDSQTNVTGSYDNIVIGTSGSIEQAVGDNLRGNSLTNNGAINNLGEITTNTLDNKVGAVITNNSDTNNGTLNIINGGTNSNTIQQALISASGNLTNSGTITSTVMFTNNGNISSDLGVINLVSGNNHSSITQNQVNISGTFNNNTNGIIDSRVGIISGGKLDNKNNATVTGNIVNNGTVTNAGNLGTSSDKIEILNNGTLSNQNSIIANVIQNNGGQTFSNTGSVNSVSISNDGTYNNTSGSLIAETITNRGTLSNSATLNVTTKFTNSGTFSNTTSNTTINEFENEAGKTFDNDGTLTTDKLTNAGTITGDGNLVVKDGSNRGSIEQDISISGTFDNNANGTIASAVEVVTGGTLNNNTNGTITGSLTNNGTVSNAGNLGTSNNKIDITNNGIFTNNGNIIANNITNNSDKTLTNNKNLSVDNLTNNGSITGNNSILNIVAGDNNGSITQKNVNISGTVNNKANSTIASAVEVITGGTLNNEANGTITGSLTNNGTVSNAGNLGTDVSKINITNKGAFTNNETIIANNFTNDSGKTFTNNKDLSVDILTNNGTITGSNGVLNIVSGNNNGDISQKNVNISGTVNNNANGTIASVIEVETTGTLNNKANGTITGSLTNNGTVTNAGNLGTSADKIDILNNGTLSNNGDIIANNITNNSSKTITNNKEISVDNLTNNSTITGNNGVLNIVAGDNNGSISQKNVNISGTVNNKANGTIASAVEVITGGTLNNEENATVTGSLTNNGTVSNEGNLGTNANKINIVNNSDFTNDGTIIANAIQNSADFSNNSNITANTFTNDKGKELINNANITANTFNNDGTVSGANSNLTATSGKNTGSIAGKIFNIKGSYTNEGTISSNVKTEASANLTNVKDATIDGNIENLGTIRNSGKLGTDTNKIEITNSGTIINNVDGSIVTSSIVNNSGKTITTTGSIVTDAIVNNGTVNLQNGGSLEVINNTSVAGTINAIGANNELSVNGDITGTLNIGNNTTESELNLVSGNVLTGTQLNVNNKATLNINGTDSTVNINNNDIWNGKIVLKDGTLNVSNRESNGILVANDGELNLESKTLLIGSGSSISDDVKTTISENSTLNIQGGKVSLNDGDTWDGTIILGSESVQNDTSSLTVGLPAPADPSASANMGALKAENGELIVLNNLNLEVGKDSYIKKAVAITTDGNISIKNGGEVAIDDNDTLGLNTKVTLTEGGTLNYGKTSDASALITADAGNLNLLAYSNLTLNQGSEIKDAVILDIQKDATLTLNNTTLNLDNADSWNGKIVNNSGIINTLGFTKSSETAALEQKDGELNVKNSSALTLGTNSSISGGEINITNNSLLTTIDASIISGGNMNVDATSVFKANSGAFDLDNLTNSGMVNIMNNIINTSNIKDTLTVGNTDSNIANFAIDVYARADQAGHKGIDRIIANAIKAGTDDATLNIADWTLGGDIYGWDAPIDRHTHLDNVFEYNTLIGEVNFTSTDKETFTPIGWYKLNNHGGINGNYTLDLARFNPQVYRGQVTTVAQWMNQLNIDDLLFTHSMILPSFKENDPGSTKGMMANRYVATNPVFAPYQYSRKDGGLWYKMYGTFEHLSMNNNLNVGNNAYGVLVGADFGLKELHNGWKFMPTAYVSYNGAHQHFARVPGAGGVSAYQNGGQAGFLGTWYKDNLIIGALAFGGLYDNSMDVFGHTDNTFNYFGGGATKVAYNWRFHRDWVLQPNLMAAYAYFGQQNWHSNFGQMGMMSRQLNGVNIAPGLNLIWEKETFSTYLTLQYMYNINGACGGRAGNVGLPQVEMDHGYIQYGIGFTKNIGERFFGYLQAVLRNAGRTGVGFQAGFNIMLGK